MSKSAMRITLLLGACLSLVGALMLALAPAVSALEVRDPSYLRAFSPNGDGVQDVCPITLIGDGGDVAVDTLILGIYASPGVPPDPADLLAAPPPDSVRSTGFLKRSYHTWHGRGGDDTEGQPLLPDGLYYLHVLGVAGEDSVRLSPAIQLELNTAPPSLDAVALEPSLYFTPLQAGADTVLQVFFSSADFDTLTDTATARVLRQDPGNGSYLQVNLITRDPSYVLPQGGLTRYRLLWDGFDTEGTRVDGQYRLDLTLKDDAGNAPAGASLSSNLDILAPTIAVTELGGPVESGTSFTFHPDSLPDSLVVRVRDRNDVADCVAALETATVFDQVGRLLPGSGFGERFYAFTLPAAWGDAADTLDVHHVYVDAEDLAGNRKTDLGSATRITLTLDAEAPPAPVLDPLPARVIQPVLTLAGSSADLEADVEIYEDAVYKAVMPVDVEGRFSLPILLSEGTHAWTARAVDVAGNASPFSAPVTVTYAPGPALNLPGRFRGGPGETLQINTSGPADAVVLRIYSLEGDLIRRLDAQGGPEQFSADWDLADSGGRQVMDGLFVVNVETLYQDGSRDTERKVVAVVRPAP